MTKPLVLIIGGTSRNGSLVGQLLLATGNYAVRMGARDPSKIASSLIAQGAEPVVVNSTFDSMRSALEGVKLIYFIYPDLTGGAGDILVQHLFQAVKETPTVNHIVYLSVMNTDQNNATAAPDEDFEVAHTHYRNEQLLIHTTIPYTILRPTWFHENLITYFADSVKRTGEILTSAQGGVWTSVAICDVAAVAVAALTDPSAHAGKTYELREEAVTYEEVAEKLSREIGKRVTVVNLTSEEHLEMIKSSRSGMGLSASRLLVDNVPAELVRLDKDRRESKYSVVTPDLEIVLGRKGVSLDEFLAQHADVFKE